MTSVPPTNNDDPDETPHPMDSSSTDSSPATASPADVGASDSQSAGREATTDAGTATASGSDATGEFSQAGSAASGPEAADSTAAGEDDGATPTTTAPGRSSHAAPRPTPGATDDDGSATNRPPTAAEDEELRAERERRFGRVAGPAASEETVAEPVASTQQDAAPAEPEPAAPPAADPPTAAMAPPPAAPDEEDPFADFDDGPTSRAAAHWWGILIAIVFGPVTWYLIADGGERVSYALSQNLDAINVLGLVELAGGLITLIIMLMAARWSSVGSIIIGSIGAVIGAAFVAVPRIIADFLSAQSMIFDRLGQFGTNVFDHLTADGHSGRLLAYGITFIFVGVISHGARRQGRREERRKAALGE